MKIAQQNVSLTIKLIFITRVVFSCNSVMSKSVRPKDLTDKISFGLTKKNISAAYFIVWTDKIFKISPNDWHVQKDFNISGNLILASRDLMSGELLS